MLRFKSLVSIYFCLWKREIPFCIVIEIGALTLGVLAVQLRAIGIHTEDEGALVVVSHDRHLLRSTTDDLYLVHDRKVEPFDGDLEDYQQWLSDVQKQENQTDEAPKENANSAQARKDQKRREAELRAQTQPLRKEIARLEKEMEKLNAQLAQAEEKLGDSELYDQSRKAELTACLQQQASAKSGLEECEMAWLEAQEQLEQMLLEGQSN